MNIVKIKDIIIEGTDPLYATWTTEEITSYDKYYRGKYVQCLNWEFCTPLITDNNIIENSRYVCESLLARESSLSIDNAIREIMNEKYQPTAEYPDFRPILYSQLNDAGLIDINETTRVNDYTKYITYNNYVPEDITLEKLKKFRTWLATTILSFDQVTDDKIKHMLNYYKNGMYDDVVKALTIFGEQKITATSVTPSCGCAGTANIAINYSLNACDPISIYKQNIYLLMCDTFSDVEFWMDFDPEFLNMFKLYIDNIIKADLPLVGSQWQPDFIDCSCQITTNTNQERNKARLMKLSQALQQMIDRDTAGHRTSISNALREWAMYLYEIMEWI